MSQPILAVAFGVYMIGTGVVLLLSLYNASEELFRLFAILMLPVVCLITMATFADRAKRERVEKSKLPTITNFEERKFLKEVLELKDLGVDTWIYKTNVDGKLFLVGKGVGFPVSDGALLSSPLVRETPFMTVPQAQPNELFTPDSAKGSWIKLLTQDGTRLYYSQDSLTCSQVRIPGADETIAIPWPKK